MRAGRFVYERLKVTAVLAVVAFGTLAVNESGDEGADAGSAARERAALAAAIDRPIEWSVDPKSYNCAGLAFRTFREMSLPEVEAVLARCRELTASDAACPAGWCVLRAMGFRTPV